MYKELENVVARIPRGAKSAIVYTLASVFSRGLSIITMPVFTRLMSTDQIGVINIYNSWYSLFSLVVTLSLSSGGFAVAMKEYEGKHNKYLSSILTLTSIIAICMAILYAISHDFWNTVTGLPTSLMVLILIGLLFSPARDFWLACERYEYRYKYSAIVMFLSAILSSALSIFVVALMIQNKFENVAIGRLIANYVIMYIFDIALWFILMRNGKEFVNLSYWKFSLSLSIPLLGYSISSQILSVSDRIMISKMVNNSAVGIYSTLYSVATLFTMVWTAINASFVPYIYQNIGKSDKKIKVLSFYLLAIYGIVAIFMVFLAPEIVHILATSEYYEGIYIMPPIAVGVFLTSAANMYSNILLYLRYSKYIMYAGIISAVSNLILNYIFISKFGYMAAAYTTMISYFIMYVLIYFWANKRFINETGASLNQVYNNKKIWLFLIFEIAILMFGIVLYDYLIIRFICILFLLVIMIGFCRKGLNEYKIL